MQEYYTERRLVDIIHDDFTQEPESLVVNEINPTTGEITNDLTMGEYDIVITSSPYRASLEDSQFEQARALKELGLPIPDRVLIENSRLLRRGEIVKQMEAAQNSPEAKQRAELEMRGAQAEVALKEADVAKKQAETAQKGADAQIKANEAAGGQDGELQKMAAELQMERERLDMELQKMQQEMEIKFEEMQQKLMMQREEHAQKQEMQAQDHVQNLRLKEQQAEQQAAAQRAAELRGDADDNTAEQPAKE